MHGAERFRFLLSAACATLTLGGLGGCDRVEQYASVVQDVAKMKRQVEELQSNQAVTKAQFIIVRNEIDTHAVRIDALERPKAQAASGPGRFTQEQIAGLTKVISTCVGVARGAAPTNTSDYEKHWWTDFDAYYNPGTGTVKDNVMYNGGAPAKYSFNKCMTSLGWPLS
jgi:hypothetical protein